MATSGLVAQIDERQFTLYFEHDVFDLSPAHLQLLDSIKGFQNKKDLDVHIKGFANSIGGEKYNLELSRKRAESVKAQLREFTIIASDGYGELRTEAAKNRRVDILIHLKVDHIAAEGEIVEPPQVPESPQATLSTLLRPQKGDKITLKGIMFYPKTGM